MKKANNLLDDKKGFNPYPGGSYVAPSQATNQGLNQIQGLSEAPNPFYANAQGFTTGLLGGQYNLDQSGYKNLMGDAQGMSGGNSINTEGDYRAMLGGENAAYNQVRENTANSLGDQIQRQFGGASYAAPENADYLTRGVGDVLSRMDSDNYYQRQNLQRGLLGDISGVQGQNFNNQMAGMGLQRGLLGDMSNLSQQDISNRMGGLGIMDQVYNSQYLPAQMKLMAGQGYDADAANLKQSQMDTWNQKQQAPWDRLAQAYGVFSGTGQQGNTTQSSVSQPTDIWSKLLGGGLLASQMF
jgi:hypothetical protein